MDRIAAARALIQEADQRLHGLARFLECSGMDHNDELLDRLADRVIRQARRERHRAEARAGRR
jgi:hypothetical protein